MLIETFWAADTVTAIIFEIFPSFCIEFETFEKKRPHWNVREWWTLIFTSTPFICPCHIAIMLLQFRMKVLFSASSFLFHLKNNWKKWGDSVFFLAAFKSAYVWKFECAKMSASLMIPIKPNVSDNCHMNPHLTVWCIHIMRLVSLKCEKAARTLNSFEWYNRLRLRLLLTQYTWCASFFTHLPFAVQQNGKKKHVVVIFLLWIVCMQMWEWIENTQIKISSTATAATTSTRTDMDVL